MISVSLINYPPPPMHRITITLQVLHPLFYTSQMFFFLNASNLNLLAHVILLTPWVFFVVVLIVVVFFLQILVLLVWLFLCNLAKRVTLLTVNVKTCVLVILKSYQRIWEQTISQAGDSGESIQLLSCAPGPAPGSYCDAVLRSEW